MRDGTDWFEAIYHDGKGAVARAVRLRLKWLEPTAIDPRDELRYMLATSAFVDIFDSTGSRRMDRWDIADMFSVPSARGELRLGMSGRPAGARLVVSDPEAARRMRERLPVLAMHRRRKRRRAARNILVLSLALFALIAAYILGVPLIAGRIVNFVPPQTEIRLGETIVAQMQQALAENGGLVACDTNPDSLANRSVSRFASQALALSDSPFPVSIQVVRNTIPNAFALPGGRAFYFSALLDQTRSPDEFAGVMAHEIGHVVHRHGMRKLISNAGTGLLVGIVLGDITGLSVGAVLGTVLINSGFSRDAEREADQYAIAVARQLGFHPAALADLLDRIGRDDAEAVKFALLSSHPLNAERRALLEAGGTAGNGSGDETSQPPVFSAAEWQAIRRMCDQGAGPGPSRRKGKDKV
ncbi:MAG TPA: M48 family metallopeptidase [Devosia sp.]|nr:M48 family metallopeptidase [Devosia sp.]